MDKKKRRHVKWTEVTVEGNAANVLRGFGERVATRMAAKKSGGKMGFKVPDLSGFETALEKAVYLLDTAAAIEHSLMLQYLYAMYSLRAPDEAGLSDKQRRALEIWSGNGGFRKIAVEEMEHLIMVQTMLMLLGEKPNFERDGIDRNVSPFDFHLEPLTQTSLAKYVVTESPTEVDEMVEKYEEVEKLAENDAGMMINHVGVLYAVLGVVFSKPEDLERDAEDDDEWGKVVRETAKCLYKGFPDVPRDTWHLADVDFKNSTIGAVVAADWGVNTIVDRGSAVNALRDISVEGEGTSMDGVDSHFELFFKFFCGEPDKGVIPFPTDDDWSPARPVPIDPFIALGSSDENAISEPTAVKFATIADLQYAILLGMLQQYLFVRESGARNSIYDWCLGDGGMFALADCSAKLVTLVRGANPGQKAALPFTLPDNVNLPDDPEQRVSILIELAQQSNNVIAELKSEGNGDPLLNKIESENNDLVALFTGDGGNGGGPRPQVGDADMIELINKRTPQARSRHRSIAVDLPDGDETNLRQLFRDENANEILAFLKTGKSTVAPFEDKDLVVPGDPENSAFYLHISDPNGVMSTRFNDEEVELVKNWILSQASDDERESEQDGEAGQTSPGAKGPDGNGGVKVNSGAEQQAMLQLVERKRRQGSAFHDGVDVGSGASLSDLFADGKFQEVIGFLEASNANVPPFNDKPLVVPGKPNESAFFLHITDPDGAMAGRFRPDEVTIVKNWIESLGASGPGKTPPPADAAVGATKPNAPFNIQLEEVASGLNRPVFAVSPPGDTKRLFIVEQRGEIKILKLSKGTVMSTPFLKINGLATGNEQGLLGLAFHPDFATNGLFYVNCTVRGGKASGGSTEIRAYELASKDQADPSSKKVIMRFPQPFSNHNGGWMAFSPKDKLLYIATGDGGSGNDPQRNGQNLNSLLGKMLRIDVDADDFPDDKDRNYRVPPSNPFVSVPDARDEIWAYGLRNPWRCSFDRSNGDLLIGDVGQSKREEVNFQPASSTGGENYGWRAREGTLETGLEPIVSGSVVDPILDYGPTDGISVIGGYVYRGNGTADVAGTYFYADFVGRLWSTRYTPGVVPNIRDHTHLLTYNDEPVEDISSFGEDADGELYLTTLSGGVYKLGLNTLPMAAADFELVAKIRIHPAIGIARVGNAGFVGGTTNTPAEAADFFVGPERPFETSPPPGGYKRNGRVRRQAARFRVYGYDADDNLLGEITADDADISWTVELANKKASFRVFTGLSKSTVLRNQLVADEKREKLDIKPGPRTLDGPSQSAAFDDGSFSDFTPDGTEHPVDSIYLGEIQTEPSGRLLVLAGEGSAASPQDRPITSFVNNDGWYDTVGDGPVRATVRLRDGKQFEAAPSWVICAPPKFAPSLRNIVTLMDVLFDRFVNRENWLSPPVQPSFKFDIFPILERAMMAKWLLAQASDIHDFIELAFPPAGDGIRRGIFDRLRHPQSGQNQVGMNMPMLFDDSNAWEVSGDEGLALTPTMYAMLNQWASGDFVQDWDGTPPQPPTDITPDGLDRAAVENCSGGGFFPGIEAGWMLRDDLEFVEPFRLDQSKLTAGDISRQMAIPWQADFYKCTTSGVNEVGWWPQQRPDDVFIEGSNEQVQWIRDKINSHLDMVQKWHELGFVVNNGTRFVETERTP